MLCAYPIEPELSFGPSNRIGAKLSRSWIAALGPAELAAVTGESSYIL